MTEKDLELSGGQQQGEDVLLGKQNEIIISSPCGDGRSVLTFA